MFRALSTLIGLALTFTVNANTLRLSEPVKQDAISETFGVELDNSLSKVSMQSLTTDPSLHLAKPFQVEARIAKVCQKKGCFLLHNKRNIPYGFHSKIMVFLFLLIAAAKLSLFQVN